MDLNLRLLRYLVTVVDEGHFGRAATKLYISPPALTQQIRRLERDVGFSILDRAARPVAPTPAGSEFLREVRAVLAAADRVTTVAQVQARIIGNRFDLGFFTTPLGRHTRRLVDSFTAVAGPDSLRLVELTLAEQTEAVGSGRVDASLAWAPVAESRLRVEPAVTVPRVLVVSADHRLARRRSVRVAEIGSETYIHPAREVAGEHFTRWWLGDDVWPDGSAVRHLTPVYTIPEALEEVARGRGVSIMAQLIADSNGRADLAYVPIVDLPPSEVVLCTRPDDDSPMTTLLRRLIADLAAGVTAPAVDDRDASTPNPTGSSNRGATSNDAATAC